MTTIEAGNGAGVIDRAGPVPGRRFDDALRLAAEDRGDVGFTEPAAEGGEGSDLAKFAGVVYTGAVVRRWFGRLVIDLESMEIASPSNPVLWNHWGGRLGYTTRVAVEGGQLVAEGVLLTDGDGEHHKLARNVAHDARLGYPWELSIGVEYDPEEVSEGETAEVNGRLLHGPLVIGRRAKFREMSFVEVGADPFTFTEMLSRAGGAETVGRLAAALKEHPEASREDRLMDVKDATVEDIKKENPDAAEAIRAEGVTEGKAEKESEEMAEGEPGEDAESMAEGEKKTEEEAGGGEGASMAATVEQLQGLEGADSDFVLAAFSKNLTIDQAEAMLGLYTKKAADASLSKAAGGNPPATGSAATGGAGEGAAFAGLSLSDPAADYAASESFRDWVTATFSSSGNAAAAKQAFLNWARQEIAYARDRGDEAVYDPRVMSTAG